MRKSTTISVLITALIILFSTSCQSNQYDVKKERLKNFIDTLPKDTAAMFDEKNDEYGPKIKEWKTEAKTWISNTLKKEAEQQSKISNIYRNDERNFELAMRTNRFYERENPYELMQEVRKYSDDIAEILSKQIAEDDELKQKIYEIKMDEAIMAFSTEELCFYFLWNYVITMDRPRRFQ